MAHAASLIYCALCSHTLVDDHHMAPHGPHYGPHGGGNFPLEAPTDNTTFLRGTVLTDENGVAAFHSYPLCQAGSSASCTLC